MAEHAARQIPAAEDRSRVPRGKIMWLSAIGIGVAALAVYSYIARSPEQGRRRIGRTGVRERLHDAPLTPSISPGEEMPTGAPEPPPR